MLLLNIYSPTNPHDDALIVGNRDAIIALRDACDAALAGNKLPITINHFDSDGEGMETHVDMLSYDDMRKLPLAIGKLVWAGRKV